ncbi:MAG: TRIC cation channel family protein [Chryseolinea sp.]
MPALFSFAISGILATGGKHRNWFGVAFMGFVTATGGGSIIMRTLAIKYHLELPRLNSSRDEK